MDKQFVITGLKILGIAFLLGAYSCSKSEYSPDNPHFPMPDPKGTITATISGSKKINVGNYGFIRWANSNNFYLYAQDLHDVSICDLGEMHGLGNITNIPSTGFSAPTHQIETLHSCEAGHGYIVKFESDGHIVFFRFHIEKPLISPKNITETTIRYQYPFEPTTLKLSATQQSFPMEGGNSQIIEITTDASEWSYSSQNQANSNWVTIIKKQQTLSLSVEPNPFISTRNFYIKIRANEKTAYFKVSQAGITATSPPYAVGDAYMENGITGMVYKVSHNGKHGMIVSLDETELAWGIMADNVTYKCTDENNGLNNMKKIKEQANWEKNFPAFKWCNDKNPRSAYGGWHLPATNELKDLYTAYCRINLPQKKKSKATVEHKKSRDLFNYCLEQNGGVRLSESADYWTSTEYSYYNHYNYLRCYYAKALNFYKGSHSHYNRFTKHNVRAVIAF
ncbi:MAG: hypothetical protein LBM08_06635 [Dysgonamonadaceae bacterium]|jgi:hypothetical protein|nr:hypothetical protein [Dysgonamonadaceae bacterium]